jgi:molybdenum cofactor guanylyltransferase
MSSAGIVLAGGRSRRMGADKAALDWDGEPLVARVARAVAAGVDGPVVVVGAPGRALPALPAGAEAVSDARPDRGPLEGLVAGLRAVGVRADVAFVAAVDLPLLTPALVARVLAELRPGDDAAVPWAAGRPQYLAAAYRTGVLAAATRLADAGGRGMRDLLAGLRARRLDLDDPALADVDTREGLAQMRREYGTSVPAATPSTSSGSQAMAVAPARDVTA